MWSTRVILCGVVSIQRVFRVEESGICVLLVVRKMVGEYSILGGSTKPHIIALRQCRGIGWQIWIIVLRLKLRSIWAVLKSGMEGGHGMLNWHMEAVWCHWLWTWWLSLGNAAAVVGGMCGVQDIWMEDLKVFKGRVGVQEHRWIDPLVHCL